MITIDDFINIVKNRAIDLDKVPQQKDFGNKSQRNKCHRHSDSGEHFYLRRNEQAQSETEV